MFKLKSATDLDARIKSPETFTKYRDEYGRRILYEAQLHDPIVVEYEATDVQFGQLLAHIEAVWTKLGETDPHWSVVSTSAFRADKSKETIGDFQETGRREVDNLRRLLARTGIDVTGAQSALEYGCGVGRVTRYLGDMFPIVTGVDVSAAHLRMAEDYFRESGKTNIATSKVSSFADIAALPDFDFLYSKIVLQHNPPPIMHRTLDALLQKLRPGGVGCVQIPTYKKNYVFKVADYIQEMHTIKNMEMHVLEQPVVFNLMERHNCAPREVFRDHLVTQMDFVSSTFLFQKRGS
jgi:trans-aconitate methyltransferase